LGLAMVMASLAHATTFWTGPNINFVKLPATPSDTVLAGKVVLTRGNNEVLYNTAAGEVSAGTQSPKGTMWAFGDFTNHTPFQTMFSMRNGDLGARLLGTNLVMWITNDDIFVSVKFTVWGEHGIPNPTNGVIGCFAYTRSTPPAVAPTVVITNPAPNTVFAAPANVKLGASASVSGGTVTNVSFFNSATLLGSVQSSPFNVTVSNQPAGSYALTAVATAAGVSATSSAVNITVVTPVAVNLASPQITGGSFSFNYSANVGLRYVVERSSDLFNWTKILTNVAVGNPASFSEGVSNPGRFYRVGRLPNP
jgi:Bacterial Ig domain